MTELYLLLPPLNNKVDEKLWGNKSPRGSGISDTRRTLVSTTAAPEFTFPFLIYEFFHFKQQLKVKEE